MSLCVFIILFFWVGGLLYRIEGMEAEMMDFQMGTPAKSMLTDVEKCQPWKYILSLIFCETTWRGSGILPDNTPPSLPRGSGEHFLSCLVIWTAVYINIYSLILTGAQSPSIILGKHLHQHFCSLVSECVCLFNWPWGPEPLSLWDHWDFHVRFACTNPAHEKKAICMTKGGGWLA